MIGVNVGDSRIYVLRASGKLEQLSKDDNLAQVDVDAGIISQDAAEGSRSRRNELTYYLGRSITLDLKQYQTIIKRIEPGDLALVVSDGVSDNLGQRYMKSIVVEMCNISVQDLVGSLG